jgi:hypothetical protein
MWSGCTCLNILELIVGLARVYRDNEDQKGWNDSGRFDHLKVINYWFLKLNRFDCYKLSSLKFKFIAFLSNLMWKFLSNIEAIESKLRFRRSAWSRFSLAHCFSDKRLHDWLKNIRSHFFNLFQRNLAFHRQMFFHHYSHIPPQFCNFIVQDWIYRHGFALFIVLWVFLGLIKVVKETLFKVISVSLERYCACFEGFFGLKAFRVQEFSQ